MKGTFSAGVLASVMLVSAGASAEDWQFNNAEWLLDSLQPAIVEGYGGEEQSRGEAIGSAIAWGYIQGVVDAAPSGSLCLPTGEKITGKEFIGPIYRFMRTYRRIEGEHALVELEAADAVHMGLRIKWPCE